MLSKEFVEFGAKGLNELKAEVKGLDRAITQAHKSNAKMKAAMNDGSFLKEVRQIKAARTELAALTREREKMARVAQRQAMGAARYYGQGALQRAGQVGSGLRSAAGGLAGSALGAAASIGAPLAVGSLVSRGLSGTAAAAKLEHEMERLARSMATMVLPAVEGFSSFLSKINDSRMRVAAGVGTAKDKGYNAISNSVIYGSVGIGGAMLAKFANNATADASGRTLGGRTLSGIGNATKAGLGPNSALGDSLGTAVKDAVNSIGKSPALRNVANIAGKAGRFIGPAGTAVGVLAEGKGYYDDAKSDDRFAQLKRYGKGVLGAISPGAGMAQSVSDMFRDKKPLGTSYGERIAKLATAGNDAINGVKGAPGGGSNGMMMVQGAGERRSATDLYEELASKVPMLTGQNSDKNESSSTDKLAETVGDLLTWLKSKFPV